MAKKHDYWLDENETIWIVFIRWKQHRRRCFNFFRKIFPSLNFLRKEGVENIEKKIWNKLLRAIQINFARRQLSNFGQFGR